MEVRLIVRLFLKILELFLDFSQKGTYFMPQITK